MRIATCWKQTKRRREGGFTLMELAVVLSIIAVMAMLLAPSVADTADRAAFAAALADANAIRAAMDLSFNSVSPRQFPAGPITDYAALRATLWPFLALPGSAAPTTAAPTTGAAPERANFVFVRYTAPTDRLSYSMEIRARNAPAPGTLITIRNTGVTW